MNIDSFSRIPLPIAQTPKFVHNVPKKILNAMPAKHPGNEINGRVYLPLFIRVISNFAVASSPFVIKFNYGALPIKRGLSLESSEKSTQLLDDKLRKIIQNNPPWSVSNRNQSQFISVFIHIHYNGTLHHANIMLYDKTTGIAEIFEPHGRDHIYAPYHSLDFEIFLKSKQHEFLGKNFKINEIRTPLSICPRSGLQLFNILKETGDEKKRNEAKKLRKFNDNFNIKGYCTMWSYYFVYIRVMNPSKNPEDLQTQLIVKMGNNLSFLIRQFYFKYVQFIHLLQSSSDDLIKSIINKDSDLIKYAVLSFRPELCTGNKPFYSLSELKDFAKTFGMKGISGMTKPILCKRLVKGFQNYKHIKEYQEYGAHLPKIPVKYAKNITKCHLSESEGGYSLKELKKIAQSYNIHIGSRKQLCEKISKYLNNIKTSGINTAKLTLKNARNNEPKKNIDVCKKSESAGGPSLKLLRQRAKELNIKSIKRNEICDALKNFQNTKPKSPPKPNSPLLKLPIRQCKKSESAGGPSLKSLRSLAKEIGFNKSIKRNDICDELKKW